MSVSPYSLFSFQLFQLFNWAFLHLLAFHLSYSCYSIEHFSIFSLHFNYSSYSIEHFSIFSLFISVIPIIPLSVSPYTLFSFRLFQLLQWAFLHILSFHFSDPSYSIERFSIFTLSYQLFQLFHWSLLHIISFLFQVIQLFHWAFLHILSFHFSYSNGCYCVEYDKRWRYRRCC